MTVFGLRSRLATCVVACGLATLVVAAAASAAPKPAATPKHPITVDDLWAMQRVGAPALSHDGRWAAFSVTSWSMTENKSNGDLWLVETSGKTPPRRLTWNKGPDSSPTWSPDDTRLAYVSKRGTDPAQLFVLPLTGGEPQQITTLPVGVSDPHWFSDGKRIAFLASTWPDLDADFVAVKQRLEDDEKDKTKAHASDSRMFRSWDRYVTDGQLPHVFAVDLETQQVKDLLPGSTLRMDPEGAEGQWDLAPDGSEIVFAANVTTTPHRTLNYDLLVAPVAGGAPHSITADNPADDTRPRYTPDGRSILYGRTRRPECDPDFTRLTLYDRGTATSRGLADAWDAQASGWTCSPDGRTVYFHATERGRNGLYALAIEGGTPRRIVRGGNTAGVAAAARDLLVFTQDTITAPAELWAARPDGKQQHSLSAFNRELVAQLDLGSVRDVTFAGAGGDSVQMFVVLPPGYRRGARYPLFQALHGGPHGAWGDQFHYRWNAALLASRGQVVAFVNFHGSTGAGQRFAESILGAHGDKPFTDVMKATDWLIAEGLVDSTRMAAGGGSYGGYLTDWILGHTNRFKALVTHAGVYDLMAQFASDATWGRSENYGATPWQDPARIDLWSPNRFAANFATPTLVLHGEKDFRVPVTQGIELYGVLTAKGVPARIVVFPDENHWILKPQSSRLWHQELFAWVEKYIGSGPTGGGTTATGSTETPPPAGDR